MRLSLPSPSVPLLRASLRAPLRASLRASHRASHRASVQCVPFRRVPLYHIPLHYGVLCLTVMMASLSTDLTLQANAAEAPNVLLILADDLGYSDLGCFGGEIRTPHLDSLAAGGIRLTQFYNTGRCCPSRASIMTGQYPHRVGMGHMVKDLRQTGYRGRVADDAVTVAQVLQRSGYRAFLSGKWHLGTEDPTQHGFEEFYGTLVSAKTFWDIDHYIRLPDGRQRRSYTEDNFYGTDALTDHAIDFLKLARSTAEKPWFLYLAYNAPHFPLHAWPADIARYKDAYHEGWDVVREKRLARMKKLGIVDSKTTLSPRSRYWDWGEAEPGVNPPWKDLPADRRGDLARRMAIYAAMIDRMDQNIGRLLADLRTHRELQNTLILFASDNGACFEWDPNGFDIRSSRNNILHWDDQLDHMGGPGTFHSVGSGWANASNTPWRLYKHYNHEGGIASPGIVHWPAGLSDAGGSIVSTPMHIIDVFPTLMKACGATYPSRFNNHDTIPLAGQNMLPLLRGAKPSDRLLYFEHQGNRAIRQGFWKLAAIRGEPWELYDLRTDRIESADLAAKHPDVARRLAAQWENWANENHVVPFPKDYDVTYLAPLE